MSKKKRNYAKNQKERSDYGHVARKQNNLATTGSYGSDYLQGSGEASFSNDNFADNDNQRTARMKPTTWLKRNKEKLIDIVVLGLLVSFIGFAANWMFNTNAEIKVLQYRIDEIQRVIEGLDESIIDKEVLDLSLELIKKEMETLIPDVSDIEKSIDILETQVTKLIDENDYIEKDD